MIKTVNLTANSELAVDITGSHCKIKNRGTSTVYASRLSGVSAGADEVISIDGGTADVLRNVGQYGVKNGTYDCTGKLYLLSDAACTVEIQTASDLCFFKSGGSGGGGASAAGVGKNVTGETYNINGTTYTASDGAEIFNDYTTNKAVGAYSHAEGVGSAAIGDYSHSEGGGTKAQGERSHAEGDSTKALGDCSHSEGFHTEASENSHAEGSITKATGGNSHAEGAGTKASGSNSHAEGMNTVASQLATHAEGNGTQATGDNAHAEGYQTTASGANSHSEGATTTASGDNSHAEGYQTIAASSNQHAMGRYNIEDSTGKYAFIIGNGTSSTRSDAFKIDWNGLAYVGNSSTGIDLSALGNLKIAVGTFSLLNDASNSTASLGNHSSYAEVVLNFAPSILLVLPQAIKSDTKAIPAYDAKTAPRFFLPGISTNWGGIYSSNTNNGCGFHIRAIYRYNSSGSYYTSSQLFPTGESITYIAIGT